MATDEAADEAAYKHRRLWSSPDPGAQGTCATILGTEFGKRGAPLSISPLDEFVVLDPEKHTEK